MAIFYVVAKTGKRYYYEDGKRITDDEGKKLGAKLRTSKSSRKTPTKSSRRRSSCKNKVCKKGKICNPASGYCVGKKGKIGIKLLARKSSRRTPTKSPRRSDSLGKCENVNCKKGKICNPASGRCVDSKGKIGKKIRLKSAIIGQKPASKWELPKNAGKLNCITRSNMKLRDLQIKVVEYMEKHDGLLVVHQTGSGKTLTAIAASQCYLDKKSKRGVVFVGPASLISNFQKEMKNYGVTNARKYSFYSYDAFYNRSKAGNKVPLKNKMLIVDEAHNLRNPKSKRSLAVVEASKRAEKRLLLTATPFVNYTTDFIPLINMIYGANKTGTKKQYLNEEAETFIGKKLTDDSLFTLKNLLYGRIDVVNTNQSSDFPIKVEQYKNVEMSDTYYNKYEKLVSGVEVAGMLFGEPDAFYNAYRRAVNQAGDEYFSQKVKASLPMIKKGKSLIYSNWISFGIEPVKKALNDNNISFREFTGSVPVNERQQIVDDFNNDKFQVLIVTKAGGEGLDLKGVKSVIVLEPPWNDAGLRQIIGRAIRYKSHAHLPENERVVNVYYMILDVPKNKRKKGEKSLSGDKIVYGIVESKKNTEVAMNSVLSEISI